MWHRYHLAKGIRGLSGYLATWLRGRRRHSLETARVATWVCDHMAKRLPGPNRTPLSPTTISYNAIIQWNNWGNLKNEVVAFIVRNYLLLQPEELPGLHPHEHKFTHIGRTNFSTCLRCGFCYEIHKKTVSLCSCTQTSPRLEVIGSTTAGRPSNFFYD